MIFHIDHIVFRVEFRRVLKEGIIEKTDVDDRFGFSIASLSLS